MTRTLFALLAAACLATTAFADEHAPLALGSPTPMRDERMKGVDGREYSLASVAGKKGTLVVFTCNSCPWAQAWQTRVAAIGNEAQKRGFGVVAINANDPDVNPADDFPAILRRKGLIVSGPTISPVAPDPSRAPRVTESTTILAHSEDVLHQRIQIAFSVRRRANLRVEIGEV